jgi:hypothetical protein
VAAPTESLRRAYRIGGWAAAGLAFLAAVLTFGFALAAFTGPSTAGDGDQLKTGPAPGGPAKEGVLAADQSVVSGTITRLVGINVDAPALALPLTMTVVRGGGTKAEFSGGAVAGKKASVDWDGGRPLPLTGQGSLDFNGPVNVEVTKAGASWALDGASRLLTPGTYTFGATVAVSPLIGGLGAPKEGARLDVAPGAAASVMTKGDVRVATGVAPLTLKGPGRLALEGAFEVRSRAGTRQATKLTFGPGAFEIDLLPGPDGFRLDAALLQGPMSVGG